MKAVADFQLNVHVKNARLEGKSEDEIRSILQSMSQDELCDLIDYATVKGWGFQDVDIEIMEQDWVVNVTDIVYDLEEDDFSSEEEYKTFINGLPKNIDNLTVKDVCVNGDYDPAADVYDAVTYKVGVEVRSCKYKVIRKY